MPGSRPAFGVTLSAILAVSLNGCSIRQTAVNKLGDALAESGANFASDDDPELVGQAVPFGLKTMEGLLEEAPRHAPPPQAPSSASPVRRSGRARNLVAWV